MEILMVSLAIISYFLVVENKIIGGILGAIIQPYFLLLAINAHCLAWALLAVFFFLINVKFIIDRQIRKGGILDNQKIISRL